jgi:hypothetical protein
MVAEAGAGDLQFAGFGQATNDAGDAVGVLLGCGRRFSGTITLSQFSGGQIVGMLLVPDSGQFQQ